MPTGALRNAATLLAAYKHALNPRLLVFVGLACLMGCYNSVAEEPLSRLEEGCLLLGFLSYKVSLILKVAADLAPKVCVWGGAGGV